MCSVLCLICEGVLMCETCASFSCVFLRRWLRAAAVFPRRLLGCRSAVFRRMIIFFSYSSAPTQVLPAALVDRPPAARAPRPLPRSDHVRRMNDATLASTRIESGVPIRRRPVGSRASERSIKWSSDDDDDDDDGDDGDDDGGGGGGGSDVCAARGGRRAFPHLSTRLDLRAELFFRARIVVQPLELVT